jgi:RNA polymerase sigma-70 factor, ECF subfamily
VSGTLMDLQDLYSRYAADVRRFALYLCGNELLADDLTSETFLKAWCASSPIREPTVKAYLFTIVRHLYLSELRRTSRHDVLNDTIPSAARSQDETLESASTIKAVLRALRQLPEVDRAALLMRTQDLMPYEEIAQVLNLSIANAKVKVHRARLKLAALIPGTVVP